MKLVIGGYAQGKLKYVLQQYGESSVWDGETSEDLPPQGEKIIFNHFHLWVRKRMLQGRCPEEEIRGLSEKYQNCIIISDETGNGIVPVEAFERQYRERMGRILTELAGEAEEVVRVICGIGQKIK